MLDLGKTSLKDLVFAHNFARFTSEPKKLFNGVISAKLVIITLF